MGVDWECNARGRLALHDSHFQMQSGADVFNLTDNLTTHFATPIRPSITFANANASYMAQEVAKKALDSF